jgi:hypothetical protein
VGAAAMAEPPQFFLVHRFVSAVYPNRAMGLLPAAFAIPGLLSLVAVLKKVPAENNRAWLNSRGSAAWRCFSSH